MSEPGKREGTGPGGKQTGCCGWKTEWWKKFGDSWGQRVERGPDVPALRLGIDLIAGGDGLHDNVTLSAEHMLGKVHREPFHKSLNDFPLISPFQII